MITAKSRRTTTRRYVEMGRKEVGRGRNDAVEVGREDVVDGRKDYVGPSPLL